MKISTILKNNLEIYGPTDFMCTLIDYDPTLGEEEAIEARRFIANLLDGFITLHTKLRGELPEYDVAYSVNGGFGSDKCFQMRCLWWGTVIEQLEAQGK
ncbi:hypothetical protein QE328_gp067 [Pseudomonas phage vB_PaM_EPA1]|uniref:Uncharacterized protein n=2 Tax=Pakpunavirus TaxID=1921407 RepID=A0A410T816_9CAUD|nr:hypothetical protein QE327_gp040 [Pseudomonas phage Henu5]YP_010763145.1 hypothetical protein QE328_gp067 [Pseudomonas phage vB_PaM_EPA1]QAU05073.1 hypothetical protein Henu5_gp42 [Pseudomonas phage Henu5]QDF15631.1 hypothetical protein EPA1_151 [Pseudomonas phage vB_PaM_EPA1]